MTDVLLGQFRILEPVGEGGMGTVFRAEHVGTGTEAAIKCISARWASEPRYSERLRKEVHLVARLRHPGVVTVFDFGVVPSDVQHPAITSQTPWLAMEYADGGHLGLLRQQLKSWRQVRGVLVEILRALAHVHSRGLVHRDLKPENVLVTGSDRRLVLSDFGIAHPVSAEAPSSTREIVSASAGTPAYMAPEQIRGAWRATGPWTDFYALGCIAYELVTGRLPFNGATPLEVAMRHLTKARPSVEARFDVPEELEAWIHRMMAPLVYKRFERAADAIAALPVATGDAPSEEKLPPIELDLEGRTTEWRPITTVARIESVDDGQRLDLGAGPVISASDVPPRPDDWRLPDADQDRERSVFGAGLVGVAEFPLVGRDAELDTLWEELCACADQRQSRVVLVSGPLGSGKTRLVDFFMRRMNETGVASWARFDCRTESWAASVRRVVSTTLNGYGLEADRLHRRSVEYVRHFSRTSDPEWEAARIARLSVGDGISNTPLPEFTSSAERNAALIDFGRAYTNVRPLIFCLEDVALQPECIGLVQAAAAGLGAPILVIATTDAELSEPQRQRLSTIAASASSTIELRPLGRDALARLAKRLAPLGDEVAEEMAMLADGSAEWLVQAIVQAVASNESPLDSPPTLAGIWERELDELERAFPDSGLFLLSAVAVLGDNLVEAKLSALARDSEELETLLAELSRRGHVRRVSGMLSFERSRFRHAIMRRARASGNLTATYSACADLPVDDGDWVAVEQRVRWLCLAGRATEAIEDAFELLEAIDQRADRGARARVCDLCMEVLEAADAPADDLRRARVQVARAGLLHLSGQPEEAREIASAVLSSVAGRDRYISTLAAIQLGVIDYALGDFRVAARRLEDAMTVARDAGLEQQEAVARRNLAGVFIGVSRFEAAFPHLERAQQIHTSLGDELGLGIVHILRGRAHGGLGRYEEAAEELDAAVERLRHAGTSAMLGHLHLARALSSWRRGDLGGAIRQSEHAEEMFQHSDTMWAGGAHAGTFAYRVLRGDSIDRASLEQLHYDSYPRPMIAYVTAVTMAADSARRADIERYRADLATVFELARKCESKTSLSSSVLAEAARLWRQNGNDELAVELLDWLEKNY